MRKILLALCLLFVPVAAQAQAWQIKKTPAAKPAPAPVAAVPVVPPAPKPRTERVERVKSDAAAVRVPSSSSRSTRKSRPAKSRTVVDDRVAEDASTVTFVMRAAQD